jgi:cyclohexa-1,5-dienecarbonyl-CoA hydratase
VNVIDLVTARELVATLESVGRQRDLSAVVLSGDGRVFSAGVDVRDHLPDRGAEMLHEFHRVCRLVLAIDPPVIAAVQGPALGGGCELTLLCDLVLASERASFGLPEIRLGVFPPVAAVALPRIIPAHVASEMLLTGAVIDAAAARHWGLANRVVPESEFAAALEALLAELAALSATSLAITKRAMRISRVRPTAEEIEAAERLYLEELLHSEDAIEGLRAFLEKRAPAWGR